ncbi:MAG: MBL fold metallo-hydrolase [Candidatus Goldbacteria bacterium]|nr:MBL fold metallo-hydrolase [Candidatus Goldiibacteriota bacterium]
MKIKVIAEASTPAQRAREEWGLSLLINGNTLFDAFGQSRVFSKNIIKYEVDRKKIGRIIISHCHWDHIAGMEHVLFAGGNPMVYLPEKEWRLEELLNRYSVRYTVAGKKSTAEDGFILTGALKGRLGNDTITEQGAIFKGRKGLVLVAGCSHPGIVKMVKLAEKAAGNKIYAVVGGLHLKDSLIDEIAKTAKGLKALGVKRVIAGHCTGAAACDIIKKEFKTDFKKLETGDEYIL